MPMEMGPDDGTGQYARLCDDWMLKIRRLASTSPTGDAFKSAVEATAGTLARATTVSSPLSNHAELSNVTTPLRAGPTFFIWA